MQNKYPQKPGIDFILKQAFFYWNKTLIFQLMFSIIYFAVFLTVYFYLYYRFGIVEQISASLLKYTKVGPKGLEVFNKELEIIRSSEGYIFTQYGVLAVLTFLYPLNIGLFQIFRKIDLKEKLELGDLFVGYNGLNFFRYISYALFWFMIYGIVFGTLILPVVWVCITIFVAPLMFFNNRRSFEAISLNFKALKSHFVEIFLCVLVAFLFRYVGFAVFLVGGLFTFPFWNAMIYSLYKVVFLDKS